MTKSNAHKARKIRNLRRDLKIIDGEHFGFLEAFEDDEGAQIYALQLRKSLLIRSLVIETHLMIEEMMDAAIKHKIYSVNTESKSLNPLKARAYFDRHFKDAHTLLEGGGSIGFKRKAILLRMLRIINKPLYEDLDRLNGLRNRCGHNWIIDKAIRRKASQAPKRYVLAFEGQNLFNAQAMVAFLRKYAAVYLTISDKGYPLGS